MKGKKKKEAEVITEAMAVETHTVVAPTSAEAVEAASALSPEEQSEITAAPAEPKKHSGRKPKATEKKPSATRKPRKSAKAEIASKDAPAEAAPENEAPEPAEKKRGGRKPMTAEEKEAAAKKRAEDKAKADSMVPTVILQYDGGEFDTTELIKAAMADFKANNKRTLLTELRVYLKPQDHAAYYVANNKVTGKIDF